MYAKITQVVKKEIQITRGDIVFEPNYSRYYIIVRVNESTEEPRYCINALDNGNKYCESGTIEFIARKIQDRGFVVLGQLDVENIKIKENSLREV